MAWSPTLGYAPLDDEVRALCEDAVGRLESLGTEVVEIEVVFDEDPVRDWLTLAVAYNLRTLAPYRDTEVWDEVDPLLAAQVDWAAEHLSALDIVRAQDACHRLNLRLVELFRDVRLLLTPTCAGPPPPRSLEGQGLINGEVEANWARFTYPFNMTRSPAASVCAGLTSERAAGRDPTRGPPARRPRGDPLGRRARSRHRLRRGRARSDATAGIAAASAVATAAPEG